jgi:hypothetical protein
MDRNYIFPEVVQEDNFRFGLKTVDSKVLGVSSSKILGETTAKHLIQSGKHM